MPNRILKDSIITSKKVGGLSDFQFRIWAYLIVYADDYGTAPADPELIKGQVFTRRKGVTEAQIRDGLTALANAGMIEIFEAEDGDSYLYFPNWSDHQRIQAKRRKYPAPPQIHGDSPLSTVTHRDSPLESNPIQYNTIQKESESKSESKSELARARVSGGVCDEKEFSFASFASGNDELKAALEAYGAMRMDMKKPLTPRSMQKLCDKLETFPKRDWVAIVDQATAHCWMEFYALDRTKGKAGKYDSSERSEYYQNILQRENERLMTGTISTKKKKETK